MQNRCERLKKQIDESITYILWSNRQVPGSSPGLGSRFSSSLLFKQFIFAFSGSAENPRTFGNTKEGRLLRAEPSNAISLQNPEKTRAGRASIVSRIQRGQAIRLPIL